MTVLDNKHSERMNGRTEVQKSPSALSRCCSMCELAISVPDNTEGISDVRGSSDQSMDSVTVSTVAGVADTLTSLRIKWEERGDYCLLENMWHSPQDASK
jgi:hypothetical protein